MKCQILFSKKNKKNIISLSSAEFAHSVLIVKRQLFIKNFSPEALNYPTISMLGKNFSSQHFGIFFLLFVRKSDLTFHAKC